MLLRRGTTYYTNFTFRGKRVRVSTGTDDRTLAEQVEARLKQQLWNEEKLGERPDRSWKEAVVQYADYKRHKRTIDQDITRLTALTAHINVPLHKLDNTKVNAAIAAYEARALQTNNRKWKTARALGPASRNRYRSVVQHLLNLAADDWGWIERAPKLKREPERQEEARWLTPKEAEALLAACTGARAHWRAPIAFALATGLRASNVFGLKWDWVDLTRRVVVIPRSAAKAGRTIPVPLNSQAIEVLEQEKGKHKTYVFTLRKEPITRIHPARFAECCDELGLTGATFHSLRHTWAAWHIMAGTPLYDLMVLGGWSSLAMLQRTYGHLSTTHLAESANRVKGPNLVTSAPSSSVECAVNA